MGRRRIRGAAAVDIKIKCGRALREAWHKSLQHGDINCDRSGLSNRGLQRGVSSHLLQGPFDSLDGQPSLRQRRYVFLGHATLSKMVALSMAALELMVFASCSCVFVRAC